jgi:hypothetical protein
MPTEYSLEIGLFKKAKYARSKFIVTQKGESYFAELFLKQNMSKDGEQNP